MNEQQTNMDLLALRMEQGFNQVLGLIGGLAQRVDSIQTQAQVPPPPPAPPPMAPEGSGSDIDQEYAINAGAPSVRRGDAIRGSRRSSLLAELGPLITPARINSTVPNARTTNPTPDNPLPVSMMVATEIKVKEEDKLSVVTIRAVRRLQRMYRAHRHDNKHSELTLGNFISYKVLKDLRSNEYALGTDLSHALPTVEDLKVVGDDAVLNAMARYYRTIHVQTTGQAAIRIYAEVERIKWPREYHDGRSDTWAINPEGFHLSMHSRALEWTNAITESVNFIFHGANQDELRYKLPAVNYGTRQDPGLFQVTTKGLGELSESITALITVKRLELIKSIEEWEALLNDVFSGYATQSQALALQRAQATKPEKVEELWKKSLEVDRKSDREQPFVMPRPRVQNVNFHNHRQGAVIHGFEHEEEEQSLQGPMLALTETPIKSDEESTYYSACEYDVENEEELFAFTSGAPKDTTGLPCFGDYAGGCKLGQACPYAKSHGDRKVMQERSRRLISQVFQSKYGGREFVAEVIAELQAKQNIQPSPGNQDARNWNPREYSGAGREGPSSANRDRYPHRGLGLAPSQPQSSQLPLRPTNTDGVRDRNDQGRGGGRLVTYPGRGNMGRAQYTNHLLYGVDTDGQHAQVEEVSEGESGESS